MNAPFFDLTYSLQYAKARRPNFAKLAAQSNSELLCAVAGGNQTLDVDCASSVFFAIAATAEAGEVSTPEQIVKIAAGPE
eukprot:9073656-Pyramimonas_sp.AAC.1